jgi:hypothetical protein
MKRTFEQLPAAKTMPGSLANELVRVCELRSLYAEVASLGGQSVNTSALVILMTASIVNACLAIDSGEPAPMVAALKDLRNYPS